MRSISASHYRQLGYTAITNYKTDVCITAAVPVWKFLNAAHTHTWHPNTKINKCTSERKRRKEAVWKLETEMPERGRCAAAEPADNEFPCSLTCLIRDTRRSMFDNGGREWRSTNGETNGRTDRRAHDLRFRKARRWCIFDK